MLCFAARPLIVSELIDGIAIEINPPRLNTKHWLQDADDVLNICPGLVDFGISTINRTRIYGREQQMQTVHIAHFSVQEYLESKRIQRLKAALFSLLDITAHAEIAQISLIHWLEPDLASVKLDKNLLEEYPLAYFAAESWYHYYQSAKRKFELQNLVLKLFQCQKDLFCAWILILGSEPYRASPDGSPIYYASLLGLGRVLEELLFPRQQEDVGAHILPQKPAFQGANFNTKGGRYGRAL